MEVTSLPSRIKLVALVASLLLIMSATSTRTRENDVRKGRRELDSALSKLFFLTRNEIEDDEDDDDDDDEERIVDSVGDMVDRRAMKVSFAFGGMMEEGMETFKVLFSKIHSNDC